MRELKAISQNLMHSNISITDGIYGELSESDVKEQVTSLPNTGLSNNSLPDDKETLIKLLQANQEIIEKIKNQPGRLPDHK